MITTFFEQVEGEGESGSSSSTLQSNTDSSNDSLRVQASPVNAAIDQVVFEQVEEGDSSNSDVGNDSDHSTRGPDSTAIYSGPDFSNASDQANASDTSGSTFHQSKISR